MKNECVGCGAPLVRHRHDCEYCRRAIYEDHSPSSSCDAQSRYPVGWSDPRAAFGSPLQNLMGSNIGRDYNTNFLNGRPQEYWDHYNDIQQRRYGGY